VNLTLVLRAVRPNSGFARAAEIGSEAIAGLLISAPCAGVYELECRRAGQVVGYVSASGSPLFWIGDGEVVYNSIAVAGKGREFTRNETVWIVAGGSVAVVLLTVAGFSVWRWMIRRMYKDNRLRIASAAGKPGSYT
jgi:hypothetical protein